MVVFIFFQSKESSSVLSCDISTDDKYIVTGKDIILPIFIETVRPIHETKFCFVILQDPGTKRLLFMKSSIRRRIDSAVIVELPYVLL